MKIVANSVINKTYNDFCLAFSYKISITNRSKMAKRGNPNWSKGQSGNPNGRPKTSWREDFERAIKTVESKLRKSLFEHTIERAFDDDTVLVAVLRKRVPDLQAIRTEVIGGTPFSLIIGIMPNVIPGNVAGDTKELQPATPVIPVKSIVTNILTSKAVKTQAKVKKVAKPKARPKVKHKPTTRTRAAKRRTKQTND